MMRFLANVLGWTVFLVMLLGFVIYALIMIPVARVRACFTG